MTFIGVFGFVIRAWDWSGLPFHGEIFKALRPLDAPRQQICVVVAAQMLVFVCIGESGAPRFIDFATREVYCRSSEMMAFPNEKPPYRAALPRRLAVGLQTGGVGGLNSRRNH